MGVARRQDSPTNRIVRLLLPKLLREKKTAIVMVAGLRRVSQKELDGAEPVIGSDDSLSALLPRELGSRCRGGAKSFPIADNSRIRIAEICHRWRPLEVADARIGL